MGNLSMTLSADIDRLSYEYDTRNENGDLYYREHYINTINTAATVTATVLTGVGIYFFWPEIMATGVALQPEIQLLLDRIAELLNNLQSGYSYPF